MKKIYLSVIALLATATISFGQFAFDPSVNVNYEAKQVVMPPSPLKFQVLFVGGNDMVQTLDANGQPNGETVAKQWHDFIGFTPDDQSDDLGWFSINHEMISSDDKVGDGGGMTVFKVKRDANTDTLVIVDQTLADGRSGKFFNVDFVNTVGETGMNCGGITGPDGRIWTAEEWFRTSNSSIYRDGNGVRDTADWTISSDLPGDIDGASVKRYQNFNWMVEIDPREAKAIRKQYNWGRAGYEGGAIMPDNKTVFIGEDGTPGYFTMFVADEAGDFTKGTTYVYKHDAVGRWVGLNNTSIDEMLNYKSVSASKGATMFNRIEWVAYNPTDGKIYFTETGRDNPGSRLQGGADAGGIIAPHHINRANAQGVSSPYDAEYWDYYGRIMVYDPADRSMNVFLEAGPYFVDEDVPLANYPSKHLSNPDGLNFMTSNGRTFMLICEDLNGTSHGRMPAGISNRACELYLLDMSVSTPTVNDLTRVSVTPIGAEITGAIATPDGKTLVVNSQHPNDDPTVNDFPFNNSLTYAITGWDQAITTGLFDRPSFDKNALFDVYPNPATRELHFNMTTDIAIYDLNGKRVRVERNVNNVNVADLTPGNYLVKTKEGYAKKLVIQ